MKQEANYQFASLNQRELEQLNEIQEKLSRNGKEIVLIAYQKETELQDSSLKS